MRARTAYRPAGRNAAHDGHACAPRQARSEARSQRRSAVLKGQRPPASCSAQLDETIYASSMSASVRVVIICRVATVWRVVFLRSRVRACACVSVCDPQSALMAWCFGRQVRRCVVSCHEPYLSAHKHAMHPSPTCVHEANVCSTRHPASPSAVCGRRWPVLRRPRRGPHTTALQ